MQVRHILRDKGSDIISIAHVLSSKRIGAVVVKGSTGALAGIFSERDLVHAIAESGAAALSETIADHMTSEPQTCAECDSVEVIMEVMTRGRFRHVPVLDENGRLCGMVSIGDVVKTRIAETVSEAAALRDYISATI
jgi:CBS domain-containing protein